MEIDVAARNENVFRWTENGIIKENILMTKKTAKQVQTKLTSLRNRKLFCFEIHTLDGGTVQYCTFSDTPY